MSKVLQIGFLVRSGLQGGRSPRCKKMGEEILWIDKRVALIRADESKYRANFSSAKVDSTLQSLNNYHARLSKYIAKECHD